MCDPEPRTPLSELDDMERVLLELERLLLSPPEDAAEARRRWFNLATYCQSRMAAFE